jgi:hypothetical protein
MSTATQSPDRAVRPATTAIAGEVGCIGKEPGDQAAAVGLLFAFGQVTAALILGGTLVAVCELVTTTNFCIPSTLLGIWSRGGERHRQPRR